MKLERRIWILAILLLVIPIANAVSVSIDSPNMVEDESYTAKFFVYSETGFTGTTYLSYTNIDSSTTTKTFTSSDFTGKYYNYSFSVTPATEGTYSIYARVENSSQVLDSYNKTGTVNSSEPRILSTYPTGVITENSAIIKVKTDEKATCKYDTTNNTYESLSNTFSNTGNINHNQSISSLSEGVKTYYVRCKDADGHMMDESSKIEFTVDNVPTAEITLSDQTPVKAGTIEVILKTSEDLSDAPTLQYSYDGSSTRKEVPLTGSGKNWEGYIVITESDDNKIGSFYFSAKDSSGNTGTKITSGNIFVVDTTKPPAPISVKAQTNSDGSVTLRWYYDGEELDHYNLYRSTSSGINYVDFFEEVELEDNNSQYYKDTSTVDKVTYYYRISAVDKAGNEGSLSSEVYGTSVSTIRKVVEDPLEEEKKEETDDIPKVLPPNLVPMVDTYTKKVDKLIIDVKELISNIEINVDKSIIKDFKIKEKLESAATQLETLKKKIESYKDTYATESELEKKLKAAEAESKEIERNVPRNGEIIEKSDFVQSTSKEDISKAVFELFKDVGLTEEETEKYVKANDKKKDDVNVAVSAKIVKITYLDGSVEEKTFINKLISYSEPEVLKDIIVVETIPKTIAEDVNEINFGDSNFEILKSDPMVKFGFLEFDYEGESISYTLDKKIDIEEVKNSKTIMLISLNEIATASKVTGFSVFSFTGIDGVNPLFLWIGIITISGLLIYYLVFVKEGEILKVIRRRWNLMMLKLSVGEKTVRNKQPLSKRMSSLDIRDDDANSILGDLHSSIKEVKSNMADQILPIFMDLHDRLEKNKSVKVEENNYGVNYVYTLIEKANRHIQNNEHSKAKDIYPQISFAYQNLTKEEKGLVYTKCAEVYKKVRG